MGKAGRGNMLQRPTTLPQEPSDLFTKPFARFLKIEAAAGAVLLVATLVALVLANSAWSAAFLGFWEIPVGVHFGSVEFSRSIRCWINDGLMTFFFFVVALELKRELTLGELRTFHAAALPFAGALGGMIVPVGIYLAFMAGEPGMHGWGTVMATDTAFVIGCLALFGSRIPSSLRLFLLSLAIFDDVGAILIIAIGYGDAMNWTALVISVVGLAAVAAISRLGIRGFFPYVALGGMIWLGFDASGIHATLTGVILGLMTPTHVWVSDTRLHAILGRVLSYPPGEHWSGDTLDRRDLRRARIAATEAISPLERLEMSLHPWVGFAVMPLFALANAGVTISGANHMQPVAMAIFAGLVFGKPIGVFIVSWLAVRVGLAAAPKDLKWSFVAAGGLLTGIGFTMSLFVAELAYTPGILYAAKLGIFMASAVSATVGILALAWLVRRSNSISTAEV
jgi:NhaA family Na+:H+ antiporter